MDFVKARGTSKTRIFGKFDLLKRGLLRTSKSFKELSFNINNF